MNRFVRLSALEHIPSVLRYDLPADLWATARATLAAAGLKFDNATGRISDRDGVIERFIDESQFVPLKTEDEVMTWEFSREIASAANRLRMALAAR